MGAPWFVGGGAEHSPETARLLANAATSGAEGIVAPGDYKVSELAVPGTSIRVAPGAGVLRNRYTGGASQSYMTRRSAEVTVPIPATGAGSGRTDLIVQRIDDPQYGGSLVATDPNAIFDPFVRIGGVAAGTKTAAELNLGYPAIALARVTLPASTGTVTNAHITDLRKLANPRRERLLFRHVPAAEYDMARSANYAWWPLWEPQFDVPDWATHITAVMTAWGVWKRGGTGAHVIGDIRLEVCPPGVGGDQYAIGSNIFEEEEEAMNRRTFIGVSGESNVVALRGLTRVVRIGAKINPTFSGANGMLRAVTTTNFLIDVELEERAV